MSKTDMRFVRKKERNSRVIGFPSFGTKKATKTGRLSAARTFVAGVSKR